MEPQQIDEHGHVVLSGWYQKTTVHLVVSGREHTVPVGYRAPMNGVVTRITLTYESDADGTWRAPRVSCTAHKVRQNGELYQNPTEVVFWRREQMPRWLLFEVDQVTGAMSPPGAFQ